MLSIITHIFLKSSNLLFPSSRQKINEKAIVTIKLLYHLSVILLVNVSVSENLIHPERMCVSCDIYLTLPLHVAHALS